MRAAAVIGGGLAATLLAMPVAVGGIVAGDQPYPAMLIPGGMAELYRQATAERCPEMSWAILAAIGQVESGHAAGRHIAADGTVTPPIVGPRLDGTDGNRDVPDTDRGRWDDDTVHDHAVGPMQFLPATWREWGTDASGDGEADPHNATDAVHSAAGYLCASGAGDPGRLEEALHRYNRSSTYVREVLAAAEQILVGGATASTTLLRHPNVTLTEPARRDLETGRVDPALVRLLAAIADGTRIGILVFETGHSKYVAGTDTVSAHWCGRAGDIHLVGGQPVTSGNAPARAVVDWLAGLPDGARPAEVGSPWSDWSALPGFFTDSMHQRHLHIATADCP